MLSRVGDIAVPGIRELPKCCVCTSDMRATGTDSASLACVITPMRMRISVWWRTMSFAPLSPAWTPGSQAPGAETVKTAALAAFIERDAPIIIDTLGHFWGTSLPNAIGLPNSGIGGRLANSLQCRLERTMRQLTSGDLSAPIVPVESIRNGSTGATWHCGWPPWDIQMSIGIAAVAKLGKWRD